MSESAEIHLSVVSADTDQTHFLPSIIMGFRYVAMHVTGIPEEWFFCWLLHNVPYSFNAIDFGRIFFFWIQLIDRFNDDAIENHCDRDEITACFSLIIRN